MGEKLPFNKKITSAVAAPFIGLLIVLIAATAGAGGFALLALGGATIVAFGLVSYVLMQAAISQISTMAVQAADIASEQLPDYVAEATSAHVDGASRVVQELAETGDADLDQLADAINRISYAAKGTADNYGALLKRGIGDMFVNLARRNQTLLRQQLDFIDHLEADERDPDRLESLFTLDHLTTQMQRNSDSILVLADADKRQMVSGTVALHDVVRAAQGEIGDFNRVVVLAMDDASVEAVTGIDLAHLLAELLENAAAHAPAATDVEVSGRQTESGYMLVVRDHGPGMDPEKISAVNTLLAEPPPVGLATNRWVGFNVVSRLSARLGTRVVVGHGHEGDDTAFAITVGVPKRLLVASAAPATTQDWLKPAEVTVTPEAATIEAPAETAPVPEPLPERSAFSDELAAPAAAVQPAPALEPVTDPAPDPVTALDTWPEPVVEPAAFTEALTTPAEPAPVTDPVIDPGTDPVTHPATWAEPAAVQPPVPDAIATPQPAAEIISTFGDSPEPVAAPVSFDELAAFTDTESLSTENSPATPEAALPDWLTTDYEESATETLGLNRRTPTTPAVPPNVNADIADSLEAIADRSPEELRSVLSRYKSGRDAAGGAAIGDPDGGLLDEAAVFGDWPTTGEPNDGGRA